MKQLTLPNKSPRDRGKGEFRKPINKTVIKQHGAVAVGGIKVKTKDKMLATNKKWTAGKHSRKTTGTQKKTCTTLVKRGRSLGVGAINVI